MKSIRPHLSAALACAITLTCASPAWAGDDKFSRVAGGDPGSPATPQPATQLALSYPEGIAVEADGSKLIADRNGQRILRVRPDGIAVTVAGGGPDRASDGIPATSAYVDHPTDVAALPGGGFLYVESFANRVRKVDTNGVVTTVAGNRTLRTDGDGGPATQAGVYYPWSVTVMPDGGFVVSQPYAYRVRRVMPDGTIRTILGDGKEHFPDNVPGTESGSKWPYGVAAMKDGSVLVAEDFGARVRRVRPDGIVVPFAGSGTDMPPDISAGGQDGKPATQVGLGRLCDVAVAPDGSVLIAQSDCAEHPWSDSKRYYLIGRVTPDGRYSVYAGNGFGPHYGIAGQHRRQAPVGRVRSFAFTADGDLLYTENSYLRAYRIDGDLKAPGGGDGGNGGGDGGDGGGDGGGNGGGGDGDGGGDLGPGDGNDGPPIAPPANPPTGPVDPPAKARATLQVLTRKLRARRGATMRIRLRTGASGSARVDLMRRGRSVARHNRRIKSGESTLRIKAPRRTGAYMVRIAVEGAPPRTLKLTVVR